LVCVGEKKNGSNLVEGNLLVATKKGEEDALTEKSTSILQVNKKRVQTKK